ncbi:outer membrane biogenesis protein BamB [Planctomycetes bacterium Pan216]|uniref:Outer membrane biogenesis protein BamB n=1 Tax=Kolteria novifilia TaxID=2527975 RepID=A0A518B8F4_9BACT|nr:outer membrane biogenesis protein BamB [Planctomycetes bacterium Pan216]
MTRRLFLAVAITPLLLGPNLSTQAAEKKEWPNLYGPTHESISPETDLPLRWSVSGPPVVWKSELGSGYSSPVIGEGKLIIYHRVGDEDIVECRDPKTGKERWKFSHPTKYVDQYGYNNGPRSTPIISDGRVVTLNPEGKLHCLDLETGRKIWFRDINDDFDVPQLFFGVGASPLLEGDKLIINAGGKETGAGVVALDAKTGKTLWTATDQGASYATPIAATIHGQRYVFAFTEAGLVALDPADGKVFWSIPFRAKVYESVNASTPVVVDDYVFISASYNTGALCVRVKEDRTFEEVWRDRRAMESHFSNIQAVDGKLYGFSGRHEGSCDFRCVDLKTGDVHWKWPTVLGRGSSVRLGDRFLLWGERGNLVTVPITPTGPVEPVAASRGLMQYPCWTPPTIVDGKLYLRNEKEVICFDLAAKPTLDEKK